MGFYAEPWLREARDKIRSVPEEMGGQKSAASDFDKLADAVERRLKRRSLKTTVAYLCSMIIAI